jgi:hypothetical protein
MCRAELVRPLRLWAPAVNAPEYAPELHMPALTLGTRTLLWLLGRVSACNTDPHQRPSTWRRICTPRQGVAERVGAATPLPWTDA